MPRDLINAHNPLFKVVLIFGNTDFAVLCATKKLVSNPAIPYQKAANDLQK